MARQRTVCLGRVEERDTDGAAAGVGADDRTDVADLDVARLLGSAA